MNIYIMGWYDKENSGDEAFKPVIKNCFEPEYNPIFTEFAPLYSEDKKFIFGGGGYPGERLIESERLKHIDKKTPIYCLGVDIPSGGEQFDQFNSYNLQEIFCRSKTYVEDTKDRLNVKYCPDLAFGLYPPEKSINKLSNLLKAKMAKPKSKSIGIILTHEYIQYPWMKEELVKAIRKYKKDWNIFFIAMAHKFASADSFYNRMVAMKVGHLSNINMIDDIRDTYKMLRFISEMDIIISMRFHGIIFSTITGTPFISIANPGKHSCFCEQEDLSDYYLNIQKGFTAYDIEKKITRIVENYSSLSSSLEEKTKNNRKQIKKTFEHIRKKWLT